MRQFVRRWLGLSDTEDAAQVRAELAELRAQVDELREASGKFRELSAEARDLISEVDTLTTRLTLAMAREAKRQFRAAQKEAGAEPAKDRGASASPAPTSRAEWKFRVRQSMAAGGVQRALPLPAEAPPADDLAASEGN